MNRRVAALLLALTVFLVLFGCGKGVKTPSDDINEPTSVQTTTVDLLEPLVFRIAWKSYSGRGEAIKKIVERYNREQGSSYQVEIIDGDEDLEAIEADLSEQGDADIFLLPYRYVRYLGHQQLLSDLTDHFQDEANYFYPSLWQMGMVNERVYGIPWLGHSMGLIYNNSLLEKAGVDPNQIVSLETLVEACQAVEYHTNAKGIGLVGADHNDISWMVNQFIYGFGGTLVNTEGTLVTINTPESKAALEFYRDILGSHAQKSWKNDTGVEVMAHFREQEIAFEIQGLWGITDIWKSGRPFETGIIPLERLGLYPEVGPMMLSVDPNMDAERYQAVLDFMRYMVSKEAQAMIMDGEYSPEHDAHYPFRLPVRKDMTDNPIFKEYPNFTLFLTGFSKPSIDVPVPEWQEIKDKFYGKGLNQVMMGQLSIEAFLQQIEEEGNRILNEGLEGN